MDKSFPTILKELKHYGLLLESDKFLPSVVGIMTGEKIPGSWWGHKKANEIFASLNELSDRKDVLLTKLISGKVTFIHKNLWVEFLTVASSNEQWQFENLSEEAEVLVKIINRDGVIRTEKLPKDFFNSSKKIGDVIRELEKKILVCSYQLHTDQGFHAKIVENWDHWVSRKKISSKKNVSIRDARSKIQNLVTELNKTFSGKGKLPWD